MELTLNKRPGSCSSSACRGQGKSTIFSWLEIWRKAKNKMGRFFSILFGNKRHEIERKKTLDQCLNINKLSKKSGSIESNSSNYTVSTDDTDRSSKMFNMNVKDKVNEFEFKESNNISSMKNEIDCFLHNIEKKENIESNIFLLEDLIEFFSQEIDNKILEIIRKRDYEILQKFLSGNPEEKNKKNIGGSNILDSFSGSDINFEKNEMLDVITDYYFEVGERCNKIGNKLWNKKGVKKLFDISVRLLNHYIISLPEKDNRKFGQALETLRSIKNNFLANPYTLDILGKTLPRLMKKHAGQH